LKDLTLLVWLTQLGFSTAAPLAGFILLALWLRNSLGWGIWVLWAGILLGIVSALCGFRSTMKLMSRISQNKKDPEPPSASFNDHI